MQRVNNNSMFGYYLSAFLRKFKNIDIMGLFLKGIQVKPNEFNRHRLGIEEIG